ncbi:MAG TPA: toll/interleukin-1 receptor domain-containing protein [Thermoanaerobaculia bacterium]|jgi:hypothetical protein
MPDLFISHASVDRALALNVRRAQERRGISCWMAPDDVGAGDYAEAINKAITGTRAFVLIVTPAAVASQHVHREVSLAADRRKRIFPLVFDDFRPQDALEYFLAGQQYLDCSSPSKFEASMDLVAAETRGEPTPKSPPPRPLRKHDFFAILSAIAAVLAAVTPFPIAASMRVAITLAALIYPVVHVVARSRAWHPLRRCVATLLVLLFCGWVLDRAALCSVLRRQLTPADRPLALTLYAPYSGIRGFQQHLPPKIECSVTGAGTLYDWDGPQRAIAVESFAHPATLHVECTQPLDLTKLDALPKSEFEIWDYDRYRLSRWIAIVIGGLSWAGSCLLFWRRYSSRLA